MVEVQPDQSQPQPLSWLARANASARGFAIRNSPNWLLDNQMRINSAAGLGFFACNLMASGVGNQKLKSNPYRFATVPLGVVALGAGVLLPERRYTSAELAERKAQPLGDYLKQSVADATTPGKDVFKMNGLIGLAISGLQVSSFMYEKNNAYWGELARAGATGASGMSMLGLREPQQAWQARSAIYFSTIPADLYANWKLWQTTSQFDARTKGRWMFLGSICSGFAHSMSFLIGGAPKEEAPGHQLEKAQSHGVMIPQPPAIKK